MKAKTKSLIVLLAALLLISFLGCSKKEDESQEGHTDSSSQISTEPASVAAKKSTQHKEMAHEESEILVDLGDVLSSWDAGDKEHATKQFIKVNWDHPEVFDNVPVLNISEQDFITSSNEQQIKFMQDTKDFASSMRKLGLHILSTGDAFLVSGDKATSIKYYESVLQCGQSIASGDYYELIQLTAKALIKASEDRLLKLEEGQ